MSTELQCLKASNDANGTVTESPTVPKSQVTFNQIEESLKQIENLEVFNEQLLESITVLKSELTDASMVHSQIHNSTEKVKQCLLRLLNERNSTEKSESNLVDVKICRESNKENVAFAGDQIMTDTGSEDNYDPCESVVDESVNVGQVEKMAQDEKTKKPKSAKTFSWPEFKRMIKSTFARRKSEQQRRPRLEEDNDEKQSESDRNDESCSKSETEYNLVTIAEYTLPNRNNENAVVNEREECGSKATASESKSPRTSENFGYTDFDRSSTWTESLEFRNSKNEDYGKNEDFSSDSNSTEPKALSNGKLLVKARMEHFSAKDSKSSTSEIKNCDATDRVESTYPDLSLSERHRSSGYQKNPISGFSVEPSAPFDPDEYPSFTLQSPPKSFSSDISAVRLGNSNNVWKSVLAATGVSSLQTCLLSPPLVSVVESVTNFNKRQKIVESEKQPSTVSSVSNKSYSVTTSSEIDVTASVFSSTKPSEASKTISESRASCSSKKQSFDERSDEI